MDPNELVRQLRKLAAKITNTYRGIDVFTDRAVLHDLTEEADNFAAMFMELDAWLRLGGFVPVQWKGGVFAQGGLQGKCPRCGAKECRP